MSNEYTGTHSVFRFNWKRNDGEDIPEDHKEQLHEEAAERISDMVRLGCIEGELSTTLCIDDYNGKEASYSGWWKNRIEE